MVVGQPPFVDDDPMGISTRSRPLDAFGRYSSLLRGDLLTTLDDTRVVPLPALRHIYQPILHFCYS